MRKKKTQSTKCVLHCTDLNVFLKNVYFSQQPPTGALQIKFCSGVTPQAFGPICVNAQQGTWLCWVQRTLRWYLHPSMTQSPGRSRKEPLFTQKLNKGSLHPATKRSLLRGGTQQMWDGAQQLYFAVETIKDLSSTHQRCFSPNHNTLLKPCSLPPCAYIQINLHNSKDEKISTAQIFTAAWRLPWGALCHKAPIFLSKWQFI